MTSTSTPTGPVPESKDSIGVRNQGIKSYDLYPTIYFRFRPGLYTIDTNSVPVPISQYQLWRLGTRLAVAMKGRHQTYDYIQVQLSDLPAEHPIRNVDTKDGFIERLMIGVEKVPEASVVPGSTRDDIKAITKAIDDAQTVYPSYGFMNLEPKPAGISQSWWTTFWNSSEIESFNKVLAGKTIIGKTGVYIDFSDVYNFQGVYNKLNIDIYESAVKTWRRTFMQPDMKSLKNLIY